MPTKVIIVGAGIAGPVLALFLKQRSYDPVIYERTPGLTDAGLSLCLQPNGLAVLAQIPGLIPSLPGQDLTTARAFSLVPADAGPLVTTDAPAYLPKLTGFSLHAVPRSAFHRVLVDAAAAAAGVPVHWGHSLIGIEQSEHAVTAHFENGATATASFVVGCDGLHSGTRTALFGPQPADFTGLTQTGGIVRTPARLADTPAMTNYYGLAFHMITYPVSATHSSFAITLREPEAKETWLAVNQGALDAFKKGPWSKLGFGAGEIVQNAEKLVKYGLYDRPELQTWHKGRVALLGDAAHPTSPHLGQGANQAFEDVLKLCERLDAHNADRAALLTDALARIFAEYETARIPRTAEVVRDARARGEGRVVEGLEACLERNKAIVEELNGIGAGY